MDPTVDPSVDPLETTPLEGDCPSFADIALQYEEQYASLVDALKDSICRGQADAKAYIDEADAAASDRLTTVEAAVNALSADSDLVDRLAALEQLLTDANADGQLDVLEGLAQQVSELAADVAGLTERVVTLEDGQANQGTRLDALDVQTSNLATQVSNSAAAIATNGDRLTALETAFDELDASLSDADREAIITAARNDATCQVARLMRDTLVPNFTGIIDGLNSFDCAVFTNPPLGTPLEGGGLADGDGAAL